MQKTLRWYGLLLLTLLCTVWRAEAQVTLTGTSYTQNFDGIGSGLPTGWTVRTGASSSALGSAGTYASTATAWNNTAGNFRNVASADGLTSASTSTDQGNSVDRSLGVRQTGTAGFDPGTAFLLQIDNTTGFQGFTLSFKLQSLDAGSPRTVTWLVQYGTGATPTSFSTVTTSPSTLTTGGSTFSNTTVSVDFGTALNNLSDNVWIRIVALSVSSGSGNRPTTGIDDFVLSYSSGGGSTPSIVASPSSLTVTSYEEDSGPVATGNTIVISGSNLEVPAPSTPSGSSPSVGATPPATFISASAPPNFEISTSNNSGFSSSVSLPYSGTLLGSTSVYVRLQGGLSAGTYTGNLVLTGGGATTSVALSGTVVGIENISSVRGRTSGTARVKGRITLTDQFGGRTFYVQDATGGIAVDGGNSCYAGDNLLKLGEEVIVSGTLEIFSGRLEMNLTNLTRTNAAIQEVTPTVINLGDVPSNYGRLVKVNSVSIGGSGNFAGFSNNALNSTTTVLFVHGNSELVGATRPATADVTGIAEVFAPNTGSPFPEIIGRLLSDVSGSTLSQSFCGPGSSLGTTNTIDVATYNLEWFGANKDTGGAELGPCDEDKQQANAKAVLESLNAEIIAIQEVSDLTRFASLVSSLAGGYSYKCSDRFSYSFDPGLGITPQRVCVIYKTSVVSPIDAECKPLFENTYNYTIGGSVNNWSSGRLPYQFVADITLNSVTKRLYVINVHAKSGSSTADYNRRNQDIIDLKAELDKTEYADKNIVFLGDYNDDVDASITSGQLSPYKSFVDDATDYTVLSKTLSDASCASTVGFSDMIDHITISNELVANYVASSVLSLRPGVPQYGETTSDHYPTVARFNWVDCNFTAGFTQASPLSVCRGSNLTITATGGDTYSWSGPTNAAFTSSGATATITNAANNNDGRYTVSVTKTGCSNTATATIRVDVLTRPTADPSANNPVCRGTEIQLSAAAGNSNYSWAGPAGVTFSSTASSPSWTRTGATTAMEGTYTVTVTGTNNCTNTGTVNVNVVGLPANVSATNNANTVNNAICEGAAINLVGSSTSNNITFFWSGPNGYTSSGATPSRTAATVAMAGVYTVTARTNNSCTATASTSVNIKPAPVPSTSANSPCVGEALELSASGGVSYNWIGPDGGTFSTSGSTSSWVRSPATLAMSGSYTVTLVGSNSCTSATTIGVTVRALPVPTIASNSPVCQSGATIRLAAGGGASYNWAGPAGFTSTEAEPSTPSSGFATTANAGVYSVTVTGANSCTATTQTSVQVVSTLTISISASASIPVCQGSSLSLTASGAEAYSWTRRPLGFTSNAVSPTLPYTSTVTFNNIGTANEGAYIVFGQSGSCVTSIEISVATRNCSTCSIAFSATATPNPVCIGGRIQLTSVVPLPSSPNGTYLWRGPNNFQSSLRNPVINNAGTNRSGVYTVTFRPTAAQSCIYTATALVSVINCSATRIASAEAPAVIQLSASPNPTDGRVKVTIQLETPSVVSLQMSDLLGRSLESWDSGEEQLVHEFDISMEQYKSGMYLLTAEAGQQRAVKKVIKIQK